MISPANAPTSRIRGGATPGVCALLVLLAVWPAGGAAVAATGGPEIQIARLQYGGGGDWYCDPSSLPNWLELFSTRTGIVGNPVYS